MFCPVRWFFSSAVATGMPLTNKHRSIVLLDSGSKGSWRVTVSRFAVVVGDQLRGNTERGLPVGEPDLDVLIADPVPENIDRAALIDLLGEPLGEPLAGTVLVAAMGLDQLRPCRRLRGLDEREEFRCVRSRAARRSPAGPPGVVPTLHTW